MRWGRKSDDILTKREQDVLALIGQGKTTKEIAAALQLSAETIGNHRKHLCKKLNIHSTAQLAAYAATTSLASADPELLRNSQRICPE